MMNILPEDILQPQMEQRVQEKKSCDHDKHESSAWESECLWKAMDGVIDD